MLMEGRLSAPADGPVLSGSGRLRHGRFPTPQQQCGVLSLPQSEAAVGDSDADRHVAAGKGGGGFCTGAGPEPSGIDRT